MHIFDELEKILLFVLFLRLLLYPVDTLLIHTQCVFCFVLFCFILQNDPFLFLKMSWGLLILNGHC